MLVEVVLVLEVLSELQLLELLTWTSRSVQAFSVATPPLSFVVSAASTSALSERVLFVEVELPLPVLPVMDSSTDDPVSSTV